MGFFGQYSNSIDAKGRIIVPLKLRENLGEKFMITKGFDGCVYLMTNDSFEKLTQNLENASLTEKAARDISRYFYGGAAEGEFDAQGRINIPPSLREYAGLKKDLVTMGTGHRIEIWDKENFKAYSEDNLNSDKITETAETANLKL
ncbi:MAG: division/cell wall cluster transcriptional repressor MraZ [Clostridiales bacterium]|jgi:MraZ protein|nr:division/cell wall cluster transcriptional repressor MraZ [Clostridiales bacterium]